MKSCRCARTKVANSLQLSRKFSETKIQTPDLKMPQLLIKQLEMHSQFTTRHLLLEEQQQQQQVSAGQEQAKKPPTTTKVTKVRRQRQSRNPQLSVARRNERERNRVKMVNNGFALLRDHLPVEYLQQTQSGPGSQSGNHFGYESAGSETPDLAGAKSPACSSSAGGSKAKKFSKVETLRAAIQHIRMLEELIRESEPGFESINIQQQDSGAFDEMDGSHQMHRATSEDGPLSCASSGSLGTATNSSCSLSIAPAQLSMHHQIHHQIQPAYSNANTQPEQFVKLEPLAQQQIHFAQQQQQPASPMETARTTITTTTTVNTNQDQQLHYSQAPLMTQVHHHHHQQQQQDNSQIETSEHTHLWIQQHQSSFMEQQMQMQQQQYNNNQSQAWSPYQQQQQQQQFVQQHQHSPSMAYISHQPQTQTQTQMTFNSQLDSSPASHWFAPSPPSSIGQQQQQPASAFNQQHQISLYSQ